MNGKSEEGMGSTSVLLLLLGAFSVSNGELNDETNIWDAHTNHAYE